LGHEAEPPIWGDMSQNLKCLGRFLTRGNTSRTNGKSYCEARRFRGLGVTTFMNALSKSFGSSEAPTSFAIAMKRAWRWASVSLGLAIGLRGIANGTPIEAAISCDPVEVYQDLLLLPAATQLIRELAFDQGQNPTLRLILEQKTQSPFPALSHLGLSQHA